MSAFTAAACRLLNYRCQITSLGIVRKARCVVPGNGFHREISTTCYRLSDDDKSGVDLKQGVKKTPDVKTQVFTHGSAAVHNQICKSLFGDSAQKLLKIMSENKNRFKMVPGKDNIEVIATSEERLEQAKQLVEKEVEDIKSKLSFAKDPLYEEKLLFDWDSAIPSKEVRRKFIGVKGNNVQQLVNQFESKVFIQVRKDHIMIKGTDEELVKAASAKVKEELKEIVSQLESSPLPEVVPAPPPSPPPQPVKKKRVFAARVDVQEDYVKEIGGRIIGVKGARIQQLQKQAGFHLNISSGLDYIEVEVEDEANLEKAVKLMEKEIEHILSNRTTMVPKDTDGGPSRTRNIEVGEEMDKIFSRLIGKSGSYVNRLRQQIGVNFILNKQDSSTLVIGATNQAELDVAVERVLKEIEIIKKNGFGRDKDGGPSRTRNIQIEEGMDRIFSRLIGKGGSNVNRLRQQIGVHFSINRPDSSTIVIGTTDAAELDIAVEQVTKEIEVLKQDSYADSQDSLIDPSLTRSIQVDSDKSNIFSRLIGKKGENVNRLRQQIGTDFSINIRDDSIVVGVKNPADLDVAFEKVEKEIETIKQARKGATRFARTETSVDWDKVLNGEMERLGIFEKSDLNKESPRIECPLWDKLEAEEARERKRAFHVNNFDRMISLTEEGKLWKFPINNDQGWTEEEDVSFGEHVFLDHLIEDFPKKGPVRHFMELVIAGLSKNPHMSVKEKHDHINWYRTYFMENEDLMREELGEEHGTIREQLGQQV